MWKDRRDWFEKWLVNMCAAGFGDCGENIYCKRRREEE